MGARVEYKTYFPSPITDGFRNGVLDRLYHDDITSAPTKSQHFDYFLTTQTTGGSYAKQQIKQTILKHESIFKHQIQELHRLYKRQRDLMNPVTVETSKFGQFLSQLPSNAHKETHIFASRSNLKNEISERRVIDLESSADVDENNKRKMFSLADLNEPIHVEEKETNFSAFFCNKNNRTNSFPEKTQKQDSFAKRTLFGVEISERNHTPMFHSCNYQPGVINRDSSFVLPWRTTTPSVHHNHWINSSDSTRQNPGFFAGNSSLITNSTNQNSFSGICFQNGYNLVSDNIQNNRETTEQTLPHWLISKPCLHNENANTKVHHINMDTLQNHSQEFFKKTEMVECNNDTREFKKVKLDNTQNITKILGVSIIDIDPKIQTFSESNEKKHQIDLNLSLDEEETPFSPEIDLEAPVVLESDTGSLDRSMDTHLDLVKLAAEAIVSISKPSPDALIWFADVITSNDFKKDGETIPEVMDYLEYMTLKLEETEEKHEIYEPMIVEEQKEDANGLISKRSSRKGQGKRGRQKRDFQKDVLPSIVSLSRREVSEDIQIFEQVFCAMGVSWQSSLSKRKAAAKGRRRLVVPEPPPPVAVAGGGGDRSVCREMLLDKSLGGWGRRTRRLPRQRCQNGGNNRQSLALNC